MEIKEFLDEYLVNRSPQTRKAYQSDLLKFEEFLDEDDEKEKKITTDQDVTPSQISRYVAWLRKHWNSRTKKRGLSESTVQRHMAALRSYFTWLQYYARDMRNPTVMFHLGRQTGEREVPAIETEVIEAMCRESSEKRDIAIIKLFQRSGVRLSELISLNRDSPEVIPERDGAPQHARCFVHGKGNKERFVLISNDALEAICDSLDERTDKNPALFISSRGCRISKRTVQRIISKLATKAGAGHAHPHQLRHSFGEDMINNDMDLFTLQKTLGHNEPKTTMRYAKKDEHTRTREYHAAMANVHANQPKVKLIAHRRHAKAQK